MPRPAFLTDESQEEDDWVSRHKRELASLGQQVAQNPLESALGALDIAAWRLPIEVPAGLLGIAGQKVLEGLGGGRGEQERAVTGAVTRETEKIGNPILRAIATGALYPAAASEAFRVSHERAKEKGDIPSVDTPIGKVSPFDVASIALPASGLVGLGTRAARGTPAAIRALRKGAPTPKGAITTRTEELAKQGLSPEQVDSQLFKEFGTERVTRFATTGEDVAGAVSRPGARAAGAAAERAPRIATATAPELETAARTGEVIEFPKVPTEAQVPQVAPTRERILKDAASGPETDVRAAMQRAVESKDRRMRGIADKVTRGEKISAEQGDEFLTYLKEIDPQNAAEYDRMLAPIGRAEEATKAARTTAQVTAREARTAQRAQERAATGVARAEEAAGRPILTGRPSAAPGRVPSAGLTTDAAAAVTRIGYPEGALRDADILETASINVGKIDDPVVAREIAETIRRNPEGFAEATRRVPLEETRVRAADYSGVDTSVLETEMVRRGMTANENAAFLTAANDAMVRLAGDLHTAASKGGTEFAEAQAKFLSVARNVGGANSEAGRTLSALRLQRPRSFIEAQHAKDTAAQAAKDLEKAERAAAKVLQFPETAQTGRAGMLAARRKVDLDKARATYEAASKKANDAAIRAHTAALTASDLGPGVRKYIASLDPTDVDAVIAALKATYKPGFKDHLLNVTNTPRALMSSLDFSATLLQGGMFAFAHPRSAGRALAVQLRAMAQDKFANRALNELLVGEGSVRRKNARLFISDWRSGPLTGREEAFMSSWAEKVPVLGGLVGRTQRGYTMHLNKLRADVFDNAVKSWDKAGLPKSAVEEQALASFINYATGRGALGPLEGAAPYLNAMFFAPRFAVSSFETVAAPLIFAARGQTRAAKFASADLVKFVGAGSSLLVLADMAGLPVGIDSRGSDFGTVTIGPHRVSIFGNFAANARWVTQIALNTRVTSDGRVLPGEHSAPGDQSRLDKIMKFVRYKLAPIPAMTANLAAGKNAIGEPLTPANAAEGLGMPLGLGDVHNALQAEKENVWRGLAVSGMALAGLRIYSDEEDGRWGIPNDQIPPGDPVETLVRSLASQTDRDGAPIIRSLRVSTVDEFGSVPNEALVERGGFAGYQAVAQTMQEVDFSGLAPEKQASRINTAVQRAHKQARLEVAAGVISGQYGPVSDEETAKAIEIGLSSNVSQADRAKWVELWAQQGALTPELASAFDGIRDPERTLTIEQYLEAAPLIRQIEQMPEFAQFDGSPLGAPSQWAQYHVEKDEWERIEKTHGKPAGRVYLIQHPVLRRYLAYENRPGGKNPHVTRLRRQNPILANFRVSTDTD